MPATTLLQLQEEAEVQAAPLSLAWSDFVKIVEHFLKV